MWVAAKILILFELADGYCGFLLLRPRNDDCVLWCFAGRFVVRCGRVKCEGLPQLSPQAALGFDLLFNCSELDITHTPNLAKFFELFFRWF
jgi:hypothetical protein